MPRQARSHGTPLFVGICVGDSNSVGFMNGAKWISKPCKVVSD